MTKEEIEKMPAGREMDRLIADLLGKPFIKPAHGPCCTCSYCGYDYDTCGGECDYSDNIAAAWKVFIWGLTTFGNAFIAADMEDYGRGTFFGSGPAEEVYVTIGEWTAVAKAPLAICRAALLAKIDDNQSISRASWMQ